MTVSDAIRQRVIERANNHCEYCKISAHLVHAPMEVDHIFPVGRGGTDDEDNLCYACPRCNGAKHAAIEGIDPLTGQSVLLFNPRNQLWKTHFTWDEDRATILGLTACGRATIDVLKMNREENLIFRKLMASIGSYPPSEES